MRTGDSGHAEEIKVWGEGTKGLWSLGKLIDVPDGYIEVLPGDQYLTRKVKELTKVVYVRMKRRKGLGRSVAVGYLAPEAVVREALSEAERTKGQRERKNARSRDCRERKEDKRLGGMIVRVKTMYPAMPGGGAETIVAHAFEVGSGRVGRTTKVSDDTKIELAVRAHIRHTHTDYDSLLAAGWDRESARDRVRGEVERIHMEWLKGQEPEQEDS